MSDEVAEKFIAALERLESEGDVETIAGLFDEECEVGNVTLTDPLYGTEGAKRFWTNYRETLGKVRSRFKNKIVTENTAALEWTTEGQVNDVSYEGVSVLETRDGKIMRFFAYFDPGKLGTQLGG